MIDSGYGCFNCKIWKRYSESHEYGICNGVSGQANISRAISDGHSRFIAGCTGIKMVTHEDFFCNGWKLDD